MILKSFSKINLSLSINKKLKIGLHDIQSYFCLIDLYDVIKVDKIEGHRDIIKFKGKFSKYVNKKKKYYFRYFINIKEASCNKKSLFSNST